MRSRYSLLSAALLLVLGASVIAQGAPSSKSVQIQFNETDATFHVVMRLSAPVAPPNLHFYGKRGWVYVDVPAGLIGKAKIQRVRSGGILWARYGWYKARPPITRIWVATSEKRPAQLSRQDDGQTLILTVWKLGYSPETSPAQSDTSTQPATSAAQTVSAQASPKPSTSRVTPVEEEKPVEQAAPITTKPKPQPPATEEPTAPAQAEKPEVKQAQPPAEGVQVAQLPETKPVLPQKPAAETRIAAAPPRAAPRVTVDFVGAEIADVLKALSLQTQTNIVTSPEVKGTVTVSLAGVGVEEALDLITRLSGYRYAKLGNTYVVATPQGLQSLLSGTQTSAPQARVTQIVAYRYADPNSLGKVIQEQAPGVQISWNLTSAQPAKGAGTKVALVSGTEAEVRTATELIETVDSTLGQSHQDVVVDTYTVKHASPTDLRTIVSELVPEVTIILGPRPGFNLLAPAPLGDSAGRTVGEKGVDLALQSGGGSGSGQQAGNQQQGGGNGDPSVDERVNTLILTGPRAAVERAKEALARIDTAPPQVLIEAKVVEVSTDVDNTLGVLWDFSSTKANFTLDTPNPPDRGNFGTIVFGRLTRDAIGIGAKLDALFKDNKARLLANPKLLVLNAKQAQIFIGDEVRYIESVQSTQNGVSVTTGKVNVGIQLNVVAKTNPEGDITLQIHPEVSLITGFLKTPVGGEIPQVSRRFADSAVRLRSGETLVIGGLISQRDLKLVQKVPLLGDLPILGYLFKQTNTKRSNSEIMVFLTATLWKE
ncbi:MAG: secretin N-terminal domain-containing protein [Armatimonadota bacterium]